MTHTIHDFVTVVTGSKEVGLMIAQSQQELETFADTLEDEGLLHARGVSDLGAATRAYILGSEIDKYCYDFVAQYPTGSITIMDRDTMETHVFNPMYEKGAIIIVITTDELTMLDSKGFALRTYTGMAYQS